MTNNFISLSRLCVLSGLAIFFICIFFIDVLFKSDLFDLNRFFCKS